MCMVFEHFEEEPCTAKSFLLFWFGFFDLFCFVFLVDVIRVGFALSVRVIVKLLHSLVNEVCF